MQGSSHRPVSFRTRCTDLYSILSLPSHYLHVVIAVGLRQGPMDCRMVAEPGDIKCALLRPIVETVSARSFAASPPAPSQGSSRVGQ